MNVLFMGSQTIGYRCLEKLIALGASVVGVVTFSPDPHETWTHSVEALARAHKIPLCVADGRGCADFVREKSPDVIFVVGWRKLIPRDVLRVASLGAIGFHASLLPKYRGFAPLNWAILQGEKKTGITAFYLSEGVDTGDVLMQKEVEIGPDQYITTLKQNVEEKAVELIGELYPLLKSKNAPRKKQDHSQATYACPRDPQDGEIHWTDSAERICRLVRSLAEPYPGAYTTYRGKRVVVWRASMTSPPMPTVGSPGQVAFYEKDGAAFVVTRDGVLCVEEVQPEDGPRMPAGNCFASIRFRLGVQET